MSLSTEETSNGIKIAGLIELISAHELELTAHTQELEALASKMSDQIELAAEVSRLRHKDHLSLMSDLKELKNRVNTQENAEEANTKIFESVHGKAFARMLTPGTDEEIIMSPTPMTMRQAESRAVEILADFVRLHRSGIHPSIREWEEAEKVASS